MTARDCPQISVVVPVYRSEDTLLELARRVDAVLRGAGFTYELILVEDCGGDRSWELIDELCKDASLCVKGIKLSRNFGQDSAVLCGIRCATGARVVTMDDDLQNPPAEILKLIEEQSRTGADLVYGWFAQKKQSFWRNLGSRAIIKTYGVTFGVKGAISSFRIMTRSLAQKISSHSQRFLLIDGLVHWHTSYIERVLVEHHERRTGRSGYSFAKLVRIAISIFFNYTTFPLLAVVVTGIGSSIVSVVLALVFAAMRMFSTVPLGFTAIIVSTFLASSVILLVIGVVAEYLRRLYNLQNGMPQVSVRHTTFDHTDE